MTSDFTVYTYDPHDARLATTALYVVIEGPYWSRTSLINKTTGEEIHTSVVRDSALDNDEPLV